MDHAEKVLARYQEKRKRQFPGVWIDDARVELNNDDLIKGIIGRRANVLIYGPSGDGKTFFTADLISHIGAAIEWRGRKVRQCLCVYIAAEAGKSILRRFSAWRERKVSDSYEGRIPLKIITRGANLLDLSDVEALLLELREIAAEAGGSLGIVVFDTLSRSIPGGDENGSMDTTKAIEAADRIRDEIGASVVFVHHSGKDATKGARGHTSLYAAADTVIAVVERVATLEKARDGIAGEQFAFDLEVVELGKDQDGDPVTTCVVVPKGSPQTSQKRVALPGVAKTALQALREAIGTHGKQMAETSTIPQGVMAIELSRWRSQFIIRYGSDGEERGDSAARKAFQRGREALLKVSAIGISDPYVWLAR